MTPISLATLERIEPPAVPATIADLTNVDQVDARTWQVTLHVSDQIMRELCYRSSDPVRISLVHVGDRLELVATRT